MPPPPMQPQPRMYSRSGVASGYTTPGQQQGYTTPGQAQGYLTPQVLGFL